MNAGAQTNPQVTLESTPPLAGFPPHFTVAPQSFSLEFAWKVHQYVGENIRFADTKASLVAAWCGGVIGA